MCITITTIVRTTYPATKKASYCGYIVKCALVSRSDTELLSQCDHLGFCKVGGKPATLYTHDSGMLVAVLS